MSPIDAKALRRRSSTNRMDDTTRRKLALSLFPTVRASCDTCGRTCGAAVATRSAQSAVTTTTAAKTCRLRRIGRTDEYRRRLPAASSGHEIIRRGAARGFSMENGFVILSAPRSNRMNCRRIPILALLALLCPTLSAGAESGVDVRVGWGNTYRAGRWNPIYITSASTRPREVIAHIEGIHNAPHAMAVANRFALS